ncbi:protein phosphatase CheZ [Methylobacillus methanolivorans]|uniref:Protein phosphatase CheZ n=1 Tax=Methylobacillus methanolivorans TaxID=1848927 RepID=A0ABW8GJW7_9PROT
MSEALQNVSQGEGDLQLQHDEMLHRIGLLTRNLHESLRGLGFDKLLEQAAHGIPDARDRLNYVARMTEQAAERVLNATDIATPLQDELNQEASSLEARWKNILTVPSLKKDYDQVADETMAFLTKTVGHTDATKAQLLDIMMAQDFQDLTGQVIKKITELAQEIEQQLVQVLIDFSPGAVVKKENESNNLMNGPQINPETAIDVVASQEQVDDLLDSLGF